MAGDGNCLPNSILEQLGMDSDPGAAELYTQLYLRRQGVKHLLENWEVLGKSIAQDIEHQYGRPDSEINGKQIMKIQGRGKNQKKIYGFTVLEWCQNVIKNRFWLDEIFLKIVASMWSCRISVLRSDCLKSIDFRHKKNWREADIILMYNGSPFRGHYSGVIKCCSGNTYEAASVSYLKFSSGYRKHDDLAERLDRKDEIWDLDRESVIFTKKRGYKWGKQDKEDESGKNKGTGDSTEPPEPPSGMVRLEENEMVVKKEEWDNMKKEYDNMKKEIVGLKKEVEKLKKDDNEDEDNVVVPLERIERLEEGIESLKRSIENVKEGKDPDDIAENRGSTPKKSRRDEPNQPPSPNLAKMVKGKRPEQKRELGKNLPQLDLSQKSGICPVCKEDYITGPALVTHYSKFHKNQYLYKCKECGKGFMSTQGYNWHVLAHDESKRLKCPHGCTKTFGSKPSLKKHNREQHPTKKQAKEMKNVRCQFCQKKFKTKPNKNDHELGCVLNPDREELKCEVCGLGGYYVNKRVLDHKRKCHGWD